MRIPNKETNNFYASFVDIMSNLVIILLFLLIIFILSHFFISVNIDGSFSENKKVRDEISKMAKDLQGIARDKDKVDSDIFGLPAFNPADENNPTNIQNYIDETKKRLSLAQKQTSILKIRTTEFNNLILSLEGEIIKKNEQLSISDNDKLSLTGQINSLKNEISKLNRALEASEYNIEEKQLEIMEYSRKLNRALANKASDLLKYRSDFFESLANALGEDNPRFKIKGDRFVVQSEVLFPTGSAELSKVGLIKLDELVDSLKTALKKIPDNLDWVLRVDGHTDNIPLRAGRIYPSNWELSTARAISVLHYLRSKGLSPNHLVAAGFGEYQPIASNKTDEGRKLNRRIEFKITER
jgi:chemotaxis protein MotB